MKFAMTAAFTIALGFAAPAWAQNAADAVTQAAKQAATQAATQAVTDGINKAAGTSQDGQASAGKKSGKSKKEKDGPNWGKSEDHRQDGERGHKGKKNRN